MIPGLIKSSKILIRKKFVAPGEKLKIFYFWSSNPTWVSLRLGLVSTKKVLVDFCYLIREENEKYS